MNSGVKTVDVWTIPEEKPDTNQQEKDEEAEQRNPDILAGLYKLRTPVLSQEWRRNQSE